MCGGIPLEGREAFRPFGFLSWKGSSRILFPIGFLLVVLGARWTPGAGA